ncbi:MAG TPA: hypothetical protein PKD50_02640, partial [Leptospiraceae bacterium]|nr:hypothetical protein [Leptospiraceae bacterium]
ILEAVKNNKPITIKTYYLTESTEEYIRSIIQLVMGRVGKTENIETCYNSVRGLVVNATRANIKRILFKEMGLDITNPTEYLIGMEKIEPKLTEIHFPKYKAELTRQKLIVETTFNFNPDMFSVKVKNNFILLPHEYQVYGKSSSNDKSSINGSVVRVREVISNGQVAQTPSKVVSLNQYKIDQQVLSHVMNEDTKETIFKLDIVLKDKNTFNTENFGQELNALFTSYKEKFDKVFKENVEGLDTRDYLTVSKDLAKSLTGLRGRGDFLNLYQRIQNLDSQLYKEQQQLLANYGEHVFTAIQDKLSKAKAESNEYISQIQRIGKEVFEINKKQIDEFAQQKDFEIEKQIKDSIDRHKKKLEEFNDSLDKRIENQSMIIKSQLSQQMEDMNRSSADLLKSAKNEIAKVKEELKADLESEIHIAELMKSDLFQDIKADKEVLERTLATVSEEIQKIEKFHTNKDVMDNLIAQSEEAFWKMSSNIEVIKAKEENINEYMNNINLLETAIRNTEREIRELNDEKTEYLNEKGKMVQTIDTRMKQMEKFGEELKQKLVEINSFERKINVISGALSEQVKKTKNVDETLAKFSKEVAAFETKKNELGRFITEVDQKVALINSKTTDIKLLEAKFNHIERLMIDLSARHKQIATMEARLDDVKGNMEKLLSQAEIKMNQMSSVINNAEQKSSSKPRAKKQASPKFSSVLKDLKESILNLKKKKLSPQEIASALDIDEEMVSMILAMQ